MISERIQNAIRDVKDFPKEGIVFKDITPILEDAQLSSDVVKEFKRQVEAWNIDAIVGIESRGFLFGLPLAMEMGLPFIPIRKKGKLPYDTISYSYDLEYGSAEVEMHTDALSAGMNVLVHDDLLATGGTATAAAELIKMQNANVAGFAFMVELAFLNGTENLKGYSENIINLVAY
jgi:adenine phosphoribosyltransferase